MPQRKLEIFFHGRHSSVGKIFNYNFAYIKESISRLDDVNYSLQDMAKIFNVTKVTIYRWLNVEKVPNISNLKNICHVLNTRLNWAIEQNEIYTKDISDRYNITNLKSRKDEEYFKLYKASKLNHGEISSRLRQLRKEHGWSLKDVERLSYKLFPKDKDYQISHVHTADIEKRKVSNYHINKMRTLSLIYNTSLSYILFGTEVPQEITIDKNNSLLIIPIKDIINSLSEDEIITAASELVNSLKKN